MRLCLRDTFARVVQWKVRLCSCLGPADVQAARGLAVSADHEVHEPLTGPCRHCVGCVDVDLDHVSIFNHERGFHGCKIIGVGR